jgi:hypothetical protein
MGNAKDYISEMMKYCDPNSILVLGFAGQLLRIYTPFDVLVLQSIGDLVKGDVHAVDSVKITLDLKDVYIIEGKAYYLHFFKILL